jgi:1-acyl-sn-glycerol-3-phosphate acyltransferase
MKALFRRALFRGTSILLRLVFRVFGGFHVRGLEHLPKHGAAIIASNHLSWADPPAYWSVMPRRTWFMANDFLLEIPLFGPVLRYFGTFPVTRGKLDRDALREAERHLAEGDLVFIYPEGGTTITGRLYPFEGGVGMLALRAGVPVVPAAITGSDRVLSMADFRPRYSKGGVALRFGPAIAPDRPRRERIDAITRAIYDAIAAMLPPEYLPDEETPNQLVSESVETGG